MHAILFLFFLFAAFQPQPTGAIAGRVTYEDSGAPATGRAIHCVPRGDSPSQQVVTDSEGRYVCRVPPGTYRLRAQLSRLDTVYLSQIHGADRPGEEGVAIRVRPETRVDVPFVLRRSGTISGRVLDDNRLPLRDAIVTVYQDRPRLGTSSMETAATAGDGSFSIAGLSPGAYWIRAEPPERASAMDKDGRRLVPTWYPAARDPRHSIPIEINSDDLAGVDLVLARSRIPAVSGTVMRADGSPASGVQVNLRAGDSRAVSSSAVTTRAKGDFAFQAVAPGAYQLAAYVPGESVEAASLPLVVGDSDVRDLVLSLRAGPAVRGRVRFQDADFPGAALGVSARGVEPFALGEDATTDAQWGFVLNEPSGSRLFRLSRLPKGWWLKSVTLAGRDITNEPVDLTDGLDVIVLVSRRMSTMSGNVLVVGDGPGELPADTAVLIFSEDPSQWIAGSTAIARVWPTPMGKDDGREEGRFVAEGLPAGAYHVIALDATPAGFLQAVPHVLRSLTARATRVTLGDGETLQVQLSLVRRE